MKARPGTIHLENGLKFLLKWQSKDKISERKARLNLFFRVPEKCVGFGSFSCTGRERGSVFASGLMSKGEVYL